MRTRHPFEDVPLELDLVGSMGDGTTDLQAQELFPGAVKPLHPDAVEKGIELPLGFRAHTGENRTTRRAAVANWQPPPPARMARPVVIDEWRVAVSGVSVDERVQRLRERFPEDSLSVAVDQMRERATIRSDLPTEERMPTRRELFAQRQRQRRGKLDPELRRLQRAKAQTK